LTRVAGKEYKGSTLKVTQDRGVQSRVAIAFLPKSYTAAEVTALLQDVAEPADIHLSQPGPWPSTIMTRQLMLGQTRCTARSWPQ
jgi:hypothetical protein